uniref:Uncharacterized protein n=1 Tax=Rhizophora mucronata TaxID=61149 RepID=A0A2P2N580_RHIMU
MTTGDGPSARFSMAGDCLDPLKGGTLVWVVAIRVLRHWTICTTCTQDLQVYTVKQL